MNEAVRPRRPDESFDRIFPRQNGSEAESKADTVLIDIKAYEMKLFE
jgi:hypothetical protein